MRLLCVKITWNVGNQEDKRIEDALVELITKYRPLIITLQEVWDRKKAIHAAAIRTGYKPVIPKGAAGHNAALLSPDARVGKKAPMLGVKLLSPRKWVGKKVAGAKKTGKARKNELVFVRYKALGIKWIDGIVHLVPSHHVRLARLLAIAQVARATVWLNTRKRVASLSGDFNAVDGVRKRVLAPLKKIAKGFTGRTHGNRGIDWWWFLKRQLRKHRLHVEHEVLFGYPSDHRPVLVRIYQD